VHHVYAQADASCSTIESNEVNNISTPLTVTVTGGSPISDLLVKSINVTPWTIRAGEPFTVSVTLRNHGSLGTAPTSTAFFTDIDPANVCSTAGYDNLAATPALDPWTNTTLTYHHPGVATAGSHDLYVMADYACSEPEYREDNNTDYTGIFVNPASAPTSEPSVEEDGALLPELKWVYPSTETPGTIEAATDLYLRLRCQQPGVGRPGRHPPGAACTGQLLERGRRPA
jgi:hypothetical protein